MGTEMAIPLKRAFRWFDQLAAANPVLVAFLVFLVAASVIIPLSMIFWLTDPDGFLKNVVAESHGTLFDLFIIGWFLMWLGRRAERAMIVRRYREEIDDFLGWKSPEASHRIAMNLRKLNRSGTRKRIRLTEGFLRGVILKEVGLARSEAWGVDFTDAMLEGSDFSESNVGGGIFDRALLQRANFTEADCRGASFCDAEMKYAIIAGADFRGAVLEGVDLQYSDASGCDLRQAALSQSSFRQADLRSAKLDGADCSEVSFEDATLTDASLDGANLAGAFLTGVTFGNMSEAVDALSTVSSLHDAQLDDDVRRELLRRHPHLFEAPTEA
jgi:uncharacterized protein YjbI with pentapeptide repeats